MLVRCAFVLGLASCSSVLGIDELTGPPDSGPPMDIGPNITTCRAQRVVHVVGGNGALGWLTQVWPVPANVTAFTPTVSLDDPASFIDKTVAGTHPLFVRRNPPGGLTALWDGRGVAPEPTIFLAGNNETHTNTPQSAITSGGKGLVAAAAALQVAELQPRIGVLIIGNGPYGTAPNAPVAMQAPDVAPAIAALAQDGTITAAEADKLQPSGTQLAAYFDNTAPMLVSAFGTRMAFIANAFRIGLYGSVILQMFDDDPTGVFADPVTMVTPRANQIAKIFDAFYADLENANEPACGIDNHPILLADNTVLLATGDTYKQPFDRNGWADGTPLNTNLMYVRSNGFLKPGWFGSLTTTATTFFDPATGVVSATADRIQDTEAAWASALYAIARGDKNVVEALSAQPFDGAIAQ